MLTDSDIIRICSDPRLERTVLAIIRRRLRMDSDEDNATNDGHELPAEWGWIPISTAAIKYGITPGEMDTLVQKRHVRGNGSKVDEDSLQRYLYEKKNGKLNKERPRKEVKKPADLEAHPSTRAHFTLEEAAERLHISPERVAESILAGTLEDAGNGMPTERSVLKHEGVLKMAAAHMRLKHQEPTQSEAEQADDDLDINAIAKLTGRTPGSVGSSINRWGLVRTRRGHYSRASVEAYMRTMKDSKYSNRAAEVPVVPVTTGPTVNIKEAAAIIGTTVNTIYVLWRKWGLEKAGMGKYTRASVEARAAIHPKRHA